MKTYKNPLIISERIFSKISLRCNEWAYYVKENDPCYDEYMGLGKESYICWGIWS